MHCESGSNVTARPSAPAERPARSTGGFAALEQTAIARVRFRVVVPPRLHATISGTGEDGGPTELFNLGTGMPYHHPAAPSRRYQHHRTADDLIVTDSSGQHSVRDRSRVRRTDPPPQWHPAPRPTGERADWWWYEPFRPQPPPQQLVGYRGRYYQHRIEAQRGWGIEKFVRERAVRHR